METEKIVAESFVFKTSIDGVSMNFKMDGCKDEEEAKKKLIDILQKTLLQLGVAAGV